MLARRPREGQRRQGRNQQRIPMKCPRRTQLPMASVEAENVYSLGKNSEANFALIYLQKEKLHIPVLNTAGCR